MQRNRDLGTDSQTCQHTNNILEKSSISLLYQQRQDVPLLNSSVMMSTEQAWFSSKPVI